MDNNTELVININKLSESVRNKRNKSYKPFNTIQNKNDQPIDALTFQDVQQFFMKNIKGNKYRIAILGDSKTIDLSKLSKYGKVSTIGFKDIFPY